MDLLHAHGIQVNLATPTASPPPWLVHAHPEILPVTADGVTLWHGARRHYCLRRISAHTAPRTANMPRASSAPLPSTRVIIPRWRCGMWTMNTPVMCRNVFLRRISAHQFGDCVSRLARTTVRHA